MVRCTGGVTWRRYSSMRCLQHALTGLLPSVAPCCSTLQERYSSLERDYEVELLLKAEAQEVAAAEPACAATVSRSTAACPAPSSPAQHPAGGPWPHTKEAQAQLRASRLGLLLEQRPGSSMRAEGATDADGEQRRSAPVSQSMELIVSTAAGMHLPFHVPRRHHRLGVHVSNPGLLSARQAQMRRCSRQVPARSPVCPAGAPAAGLPAAEEGQAAGQAAGRGAGARVQADRGAQEAGRSVSWRGGSAAAG